MYYVYFIENCNNTFIYVGSTSRFNPRERWYEHKRGLQRGNHHNIYLQNAWNKYREENFVWYLISVHNTISEALATEENWRTFFTELGCCYNLQPIKSGGILSDEAKLKRSGPLSGFYGKKHSIETKIYLSSIRRGRKLSDDWKEKIGLATKGKKQSDSLIEKRSKALYGKYTRGQKYEAFGEYKTIIQWSRDYRCVVNKDCLKYRVQGCGWNLERALVTKKR